MDKLVQDILNRCSTSFFKGYVFGSYVNKKLLTDLPNDIDEPNDIDICVPNGELHEISDYGYFGGNPDEMINNTSLDNLIKDKNSIVYYLNKTYNCIITNINFGQEGISCFVHDLNLQCYINNKKIIITLYDYYSIEHYLNNSPSHKQLVLSKIICPDKSLNIETEKNEPVMYIYESKNKILNSDDLLYLIRNKLYYEAEYNVSKKPRDLENWTCLGDFPENIEKHRQNLLKFK